MLSRLARIAALAAIAVGCVMGFAHDGAAQSARATRKDASAIRACADKHAQNINEAERRCIFAIVVEPCTKTKVGQSSQGASACPKALKIRVVLLGRPASQHSQVQARTVA